MKYIVIVALGVPLAAYVWAAMRTPRSKVSTAAGYFIAYRQVGTAPFANSSLAYAFQVATLFPFLYWGVQGQILPALVNAVCWGFGILLFRMAIPRIIQIFEKSGKPETLHGLLGNTYSSKSVRQISAWVTISGMIGMALAEAYWGMQVVRVLVQEDTPAYYALVFGALLFVLTYIWYGGTWGSMRTDMLQLVFSYVGFTVVFLFAMWRIAQSTTIMFRPESAIVAISMTIGGAMAVFTRLRTGIKSVAMMDPTSESSPHSNPIDKDDKFWTWLSPVLSWATLIAMGLLALGFAWYFTKSFRSSSLSSLANPGDPGWVGLMALIVLPLGFQFVDMGSWQRLQSLAGTSDEVRRRAKSGLLLYAIESPFSWILCLALGTLLITTTPELLTASDKAGPLAAYPRLLIESGSVGHFLIATMFMMGVMGVMLSTIDSVILAAMYAFVADVHGCEFHTHISSTGGGEATEEELSKIAQDRKDLLSGKKATFWLIIAVSTGVVLLGWVLGTPEKLIGIMVGFYGALLSLLPAVIMMLLGGSSGVSGKRVAVGIVAGVTGTLAFTVWGLFNSSMSWYGVFVSPIVAAVPFFFPRIPNKE